MLDADTSTPEEPTNSTDQVAPAADAAPAEVNDGAAPAKKAAKKAAKKTGAKKTAKKAAKKTAASADAEPADTGDAAAPSDESGSADSPAPKKKAAKKAASRPKKAAEAPAAGDELEGTDDSAGAAAPMVLFQAPEKTTPARKRTTKKAAAAAADADSDAGQEAAPGDDKSDDKSDDKGQDRSAAAKKSARRPAKKAAATPEGSEGSEGDETEADAAEGADAEGADSDSGEGGPRRRRRRGGRRRRRGAGEDADAESGDEPEAEAEGDSEDSDTEGGQGGTRRRTRVRKPRNPEDEITSIGGSTRLEAKKQRRREGREAGRRRAPIVSEAEFLARREAVDRVMVIRQKADLTQIGVIEDKVLVEHYVARESQTSLIGNIYLGRVQNVLPSMEAAFIDIGKGRNAVLYAGEVNWSALGHKDGQARKVESVLKSGQTILVQVTKDPVGHKGARLTGQISLPGRFLVYVPDGNTSGISRKLPDTERNRLKTLLKEIVPDTAGVIVRTAAEGASEEELTQDVERLTARWAEIEKKVAAGKSPELLYGEPDLTLKVVRDLFTEDFSKLVVQGDDAWKLVDGYVTDVAPDLSERLERYDPADGRDIFAAYRIDEQIAKGLDRKVWLPSGGSLIIDRTEAMTVVDVNTGKFTGSGGNLEETVTKNNLEAAEEMVRQLRLRDIGGIIVIDFIDMVLESNRDLVLRRLVECLGRDRTRHQVAEVTSLGLVQMTRKRIGTGLLEAFSEDCDHCKGRGVIVHEQPIEPSNRSVGMGGGAGGDEPRGRRARGGRNRGRGEGETAPVESTKPSPKVLAGTKPHAESELITDIEIPEIELVETLADAPEVEPVETPETEATEKPKGAGTRNRRRATRPAAEPVVESTPDVEPVEPPAAEEADAVRQDQEPAEQARTEPVAAPIVVTTTRRRRAARPAGPAAVGGTPEPAPVTESPDPAPAAGDEPANDPGNGTAEGDGTAGEGQAQAPVFHVPVKKKGSRKR